MKVMRVVILITIPIFIIMVFASLLTTKQYLLLSKGRYESHNEIEFDHDYAADRIMGYLNYRYDELQYEENGVTMFRQTEIDHMVDVKNLYTSLRLIAIGSLIIGVSISYLMYKRDKKYLWETYKLMYIGPTFFVLFLGGWILIDFAQPFRVFHELLFTNDDWILYSTDTLILILPQMFWMVSGLIILILFSVSIGGIYLYSAKTLHKLSYK